MPDLPENPVDRLQATKRAFLDAWFNACKLAPNNPHRHQEIVSVSNAMHQIAEIARVLGDD